MRRGSYVFKRAEGEGELEAVHRLNYRTFVREIPQHPEPAEPTNGGAGRLVDKFHAKNVYFVALKEGRVVGMVSAHGDPPFSVAGRLADPALLARPGCRPLEVRLLAVEPEERNGIALAGLFGALYEHARAAGATDLFISAVSQRVELYERLGFEPLGPAVGEGQASFVPMRAALAHLRERQSRLVRRLRVEEAPGPPVSLLPGPVPATGAVRAAYAQPPLYHRSPEFVERFERLRQRLGELVGGRDVALWNGCGTLANEVVAATLAAERSPSQGMILVNGEFGERLARQAHRAGLRPRVLAWPWGKPWNWEEIETLLATEPPGSWVWGVHLETSTGVLNDLPRLVRTAGERDLRVCMDCVSSLGAVPLDLTGVYLATGVAGKALGAYAGLSMVFADRSTLRPIDPARLPDTFDLTTAFEARGPLHTFPSAVVLAAEAALAGYGTEEKAHARYAHIEGISRYVRERLRALGLPPLAEEENAGPGIATFNPPSGESSEAFVARCLSWGLLIGGQSGYLAKRGLVQIATMGALTREEVEPLFERLAGWLGGGS